MYVTGPAIDPVGRGHAHKTPCCAPCADGGTCDSHKTLAGEGLGRDTLLVIGGAVGLAYLMFGRKKRNPNPRGPKDWYVYSKERGARRAEFTHGPYTEGVAKARRTKEIAMGLTASMRRKAA